MVSGVVVNNLTVKIVCHSCKKYGTSDFRRSGTYVLFRRGNETINFYELIVFYDRRTTLSFRESNI